MKRGVAARAVEVGAVLVAALALAAPARGVTLVNPDGTPVAGQWQQWADEAKAPTYRGTVIFLPVSVLCQYPNGAVVAGCSTGPRLGAPFYELAASDRDSLYFELGHILDWSVLTSRDRRHLAWFWHRRHRPWWDSTASLDQGSEDGLESQFADAYSACAWGERDIGEITGGASWFAPPGTLGPPSIFPRTDAGTCGFIARVGRRR